MRTYTPSLRIGRRRGALRRGAPGRDTRHRGPCPRRALRRGLLVMLVPLLPLLPLACGGEDGPPTGPNGGGEPAAVVASHAALDFTALGDSTRLTAEVRDAAGNALDGVAVTWASTDEDVARVRASGRGSRSTGSTTPGRSTSTASASAAMRGCSCRSSST